MSIAYLGLGTNMGFREKNLERGLAYLKNNKDISVKRLSSVYETEPVGGPPQGKYLNAVLEIETILPPQELLAVLKGIEKRLGRKLSGRNFPRIIDIDILLYDDIALNGADLTIPHPRMYKREFVLRGLRELSPERATPR